jgi:prevent-host-death family protein
MIKVPLKKVASQLADLVKRVNQDGERIIITHKRKKIAALVAVDDAEWLEEMDREDVEAAKKALAEPGKNIPWEKVKAELGLP